MIREEIITNVHDIVNEIVRLQEERTEMALAEIITKYDFLVGSKEYKYKLMEILPNGANIMYSPYIEDPTVIYAIKKVDVREIY